MLTDWLEQGEIQRLVLAVSNVDTQQVLERWDFDIQHEPGFGPQSIKE